MSQVPEHLLYTDTHEWIKPLEDNIVMIGVTDHAQSLLGDLVFVELPEVGISIDQGSEVAVVESVKAASDVYSPVAGEIVEVNTQLETSPEQLNSDPYESGWLFQIKLDDPSVLNDLMCPADYLEAIEMTEAE